MIFNLNNPIGLKNAQQIFDELIKKGARVEIKEHRQTRTTRQNNALHLLFELVAKELNDLGIPFVYNGLKGMQFETQWTKQLFKDFVWKPIQKVMFGTDSTTKLTTEQIDKIFESINKFFAERGIEVTFPNEFDYYLKFYEKNERKN
jgi:Ser-tRNA(Ala) deacylase AlaX